MSTTEKFLLALKEVVFLADRVKSLEEKIDKLSGTVVDVDRRLIRIETLVEFSQYKRLPPHKEQD
ncbi:MAG TPA: hypothetical protein VGB94_02270 [Acidobacteriaceae bacterium]